MNKNSTQSHSAPDTNPNNRSNAFQWLFLDLNSYFASVEQQIQPQLRGKPIAVCPVLADSSACIAASYEAKAYGIKTGTRIGDAKKMCPGIVFVHAQHEMYVEYHQKIIEAIERCHPVTSVHSIDEMALRLSGRDQIPENAIQLACEIKNSIYKVGSELHCSIGLSVNRILAKIASDIKKPNGLTTISQSEIYNKLSQLQLRDIPGIGKKMEERLFKYQICTMEKLLSSDSHTLREVWGGIWGKRMYEWLRGKDFDVLSGENKSLSHQHVLPPQLRNTAGAYSIAQKLLLKGAVRLRRHNLWSSRFYIGIRYMDQTKWSHEVRMLECQDSITLLEILQKVWATKPLEFSLKKPIKVTIGLLDLIDDKERTFSLFENTRRLRLSQAIDSLNTKYGKDTIYFGGVHNIKAAAPTRIAFSSIPDFTI